MLEGSAILESADEDSSIPYLLVEEGQSAEIDESGSVVESGVIPEPWWEAEFTSTIDDQPDEIMPQEEVPPSPGSDNMLILIGLGAIFAFDLILVLIIRRIIKSRM